MPTLGVNIDHVATVRQARKTDEPDMVAAAREAELGGADQITIHLREDRRHIQDVDVHQLAKTVNVRLNLEMACIDEMVALALQIKPHQVCLVPEKRQEVTTEGGLDVIANRDRLAAATSQLNDAGILVSFFLDPNIKQIELARELGAGAIEIHTGCYANATDEAAQQRELQSLLTACQRTRELGIHLHAGHGLTYRNVLPVAKIDGLEELNIGHTIIARALFVGLRSAVEEMKSLVTV